MGLTVSWAHNSDAPTPQTRIKTSFTLFRTLNISYPCPDAYLAVGVLVILLQRLPSPRGGNSIRHGQLPDSPVLGKLNFAVTERCSESSLQPGASIWFVFNRSGRGEREWWELNGDTGNLPPVEFPDGQFPENATS
jgi:hypothetical protein